MGNQHTEVPSPGVAAFIGFAAQAKLARFESTGASALPFQFYSRGRYRGGSLIGRGVLTTSPLVGPLCRSAGARSTAQPWHLVFLTERICAILILAFACRHFRIKPLIQTWTAQLIRFSGFLSENPYMTNPPCEHPTCSYNVLLVSLQCCMKLAKITVLCVVIDIPSLFKLERFA